MSNNNHNSINNDDESAETGDINMQELEASIRPSRVIKNRLMLVVSLTLAVVGVSLLLASSGGKVFKPSSISSLNTVTPVTGAELFSLF
jgi:hypothetical protein